MPNPRKRQNSTSSTPLRVGEMSAEIKATLLSKSIRKNFDNIWILCTAKKTSTFTSSGGRCQAIAGSYVIIWAEIAIYTG